ncbi:transmembrane protein 252 [Leopardus geoffroyi]|uniref:transmembrane protein 252 n=1 Tax=Leopardus geoffroyi TaxID=46844 RepID=UPI001E26344A|nr:transmembrane protein 252 [Leopardus geoffroyi]
MRNRTGLVLCALVLLTGFLMICLGAFLISSGSMFNCRGNLILAYMLLPLGFVILLSGIFWSTYRQARESKGVFTHVLRRHLAHGALPLATVDRPDFYPLRMKRVLMQRSNPVRQRERPRMSLHLCTQRWALDSRIHLTPAQKPHLPTRSPWQAGWRQPHHLQDAQDAEAGDTL